MRNSSGYGFQAFDLEQGILIFKFIIGQGRDLGWPELDNGKE